MSVFKPAAFTAIELGIQIHLFDALAKDGDSPKKASDIAQQLHVDPLLVGKNSHVPISLPRSIFSAFAFTVKVRLTYGLLARLLRHLAAMGHVRETGPDEYKPTNFSKSVNFPLIGDGYPLMYVIATS